MDFKYAINPYSTLPILLLNTHIGLDSEEGMGIDGKQFARELFEIDSKCPIRITIYVNSLGGDVEHGFDIMTAISDCVSYVKVIIHGFAYSTMGWAILPANEIEVRGHGQWMCHMPKKVAGDAPSPFLDMVTKSIINILSNKSGRNGKVKKSETEITDMMYNKTYYSAAQMCNEGFADRVVNSEIEEKKYDYKQYQNILNKEVLEIPTIKNHNEMAFPKAANRLNLNEEATDDQLASAIDAIKLSATNFENSARNATSQLEAVRATNSELHTQLAATNSSKTEKEQLLAVKEQELTATNSALAEVRLQLAKAQEQVVAAQNKEKETQDAANLERATNLVEKHKSKLKEGTDKVYLEMAVENYDRTEALLENMFTSVELPKANNMIIKGVDNSKKEETSFQKAKNVVKERIAEERKAKVA